MNIIILESQLKSLIESEKIGINPENLIFIEKFYEKENFLPTYKTLENLPQKKVGDYYPEHPNANVNLKTFVNIYGRDLNDIRSMLEDKYKIKVNDKKTRHRTYVSVDGKHRFKSLFENIFYNIFVQYGFADKLIYESREFYADCQKIPDFKLEDEKLVVEIGGMEKQEYWEKLENAKECFNKKGYNTKIINVRNDQKNHRYLKFYENICELFGFPIKEDILKNPIKIINFRNINEKFMKDYIDKQINRFDRKRGETDMLTKFIKHFGYEGINDYKTKHDLGRFENSESGIRKKVVELVKEKLKIDDIAKKLGISSGTVDFHIKNAKQHNELPKVPTNKDVRDFENRKVADRPSKETLEKDLEELGSYNKVGQKYGVSHATIKKWINKNNEKN
jgi:transposase